MKKISKLIPMLALSSIVAIGCVGCNGASNSGKEDYTSSNSEYVTEITNGYVKLFSSEPVYNEVAKTIERTITATVKPDHAPDKSVDWSASWGTNKEGDDAKVEDYLTVRPETDGSNIATIIVKKPFFDSDINVTATTRVGELSATCNVTYEGIPTKTVMSIDDKTYNSGDVVDLVKGGTYQITLQSQNVLGNSSAKYDDYEIASIEGVGGFYFTYDYLDDNGNKVTSDEKYVDFSTLKCDDYSICYLGTLESNNFVDASIVGKTLTVKLNKIVQDFRSCLSYNSAVFTSTGTLSAYWELMGFFYTGNFDLVKFQENLNADFIATYSRTADEGCYIRLTVREKNTGIESYLDINMVPTVENIELDADNLVI